MNTTSMVNRSRGRAGMLLAVAMLAGCVSNSGGGNPGTLIDHEFPFGVTPVPGTGNPTHIDVQPLAELDGLHGGGNVRVEVNSNSNAEKYFVTWKSSKPFWIRFEPMNSNNGHGGDRFGPGDFTESTAGGTTPPTYSYRLDLKPGRVRKTYSAKYFLTFGPLDPADPKTKSLGFVLDPVIIVDR